MGRSESSSSSGASSSGSEEDVWLGLQRVHRGSVLRGSYRIQGLLGKGGFASVWLCRDVLKGGEVALKLYKAGDRCKDFAEGEIAVLEAVARCSPPCLGGAAASAASGEKAVVGLQQHFWQESQACLVLDLLGASVLELARHCRRDQLPVPLLRVAARDALRGLDFLHRACGVIHTDVKPENLLMTHLDGPVGSSGAKRQRCMASCARRRRAGCEAALEGAPVRFALADMGNSCFADKKVSDFIQTCEYKAPEVLLGAGYDFSTDLWSLGCTLFECASGRYLLDPRRTMARPRALAAADTLEVPCQPSEGSGLGTAAESAAAASGRGSPSVPLEEEHIAQIVELAGPLPEELLKRGLLTHELLKEQEEGWRLKNIGKAMGQLTTCAVRERLQEHLGSAEELSGFVELLEQQLLALPSRRPSAQVLLEASEWLWQGAARSRRTGWDEE